jgi:hypothetical protein
VAGRDTGVPLLVDRLLDLPFLDALMRKPQRFYPVAQLAFALLVACAWKGVVARFQEGLARRVVAAAALVLLPLESWTGPLATWSRPGPAWALELAQHEEIASIVDLPVQVGTEGSRETWLQTAHGKAITRGYVTSLALSPERQEELLRWVAANDELVLGRPEPLLELVRDADVDAVVLHGTVISNLDPAPDEEPPVWGPFALVGRELVRDRQRSVLEERPLAPAHLRAHRMALAAAFGPPLLKGPGVWVYRVR